MRGTLCSARSVRDSDWVPSQCQYVAVLLYFYLSWTRKQHFTVWLWTCVFSLAYSLKINEVVSQSRHPLCFNTKGDTPVTPGGNPIFTSLSVYCFPGTVCKHGCTGRLNNLPPVVSSPEFYPEHRSVSKHAPHITPQWFSYCISIRAANVRWGMGRWWEACKASSGREVKAVPKPDQVISHLHSLFLCPGLRSHLPFSIHLQALFPLDWGFAIWVSEISVYGRLLLALNILRITGNECIDPLTCDLYL